MCEIRNIHINAQLQVGGCKIFHSSARPMGYDAYFFVVTTSEDVA